MSQFKIPEIYLNQEAKLTINLDNTAESYLKRGISQKEFLGFVSQIVEMIEKCMKYGLSAEFDLKQMEVTEGKIYFKVTLDNNALTIADVKEYLKSLAYTAVFNGNDFLPTVYAYLSYLDANNHVSIMDIGAKITSWINGKEDNNQTPGNYLQEQSKVMMPVEQVRPQSVEPVRTQPVEPVAPVKTAPIQPVATYQQPPLQAAVREKVAPNSQYVDKEIEDGETGVLDPAFWRGVDVQETQENDDPNRIRRSSQPNLVKQAPVRKQAIICLANGQGRASINKDDFSIGKDPGCDYVLNAATISREHAHIAYFEDGYAIIDNNSTNGTFVNGARLEPGKPYKLTGKEQIKLSDCIIQVLI